MHIGKFAAGESAEPIRTHAPPTKTDVSSRLSVHYMTINGQTPFCYDGSAVASSGAGSGSEYSTVSRDTARVSAT